MVIGPCTGKDMLSSKKTFSVLHALVLSADKLKRLSLPEDVLNPLIDLVSLVSLRRQMGEDRPAFIGFIGCTGTGKSTLFNSFIGREISLTGWKVHNTCGPVLFLQDSVFKTLREWETKLGPLLLPALKRVVHSTADYEAFISENQQKGSPERLHLVSRPGNKNGDFFWQDSRGCVFVDLPDINTSPAFEENLVALSVLPWLDIVIFMVDDETIFHRIYEQPVQLANEFEQQRFCVLSNRGQDRVDFKHPDIEQATAFFGVDEIHILPELKGKAYFDIEPAFIRFKKRVAENPKYSPPKPLLKRISKLAQLALEENARRQQVLKSLEKEISRTITSALVKEAQISLEKILHDDVLQALKHLGLKRFAVSNLLHFLKTAARRGSLKHSFKLSFGNRRDIFLFSTLQFDREKLVNEVAKRLTDYRERILLTLRSHADIDIIEKIEPAFNTLIHGLIQTKVNADEFPPYYAQLQTIAQKFEQKCSDLLVSDSVSAIIRNDPLIATFLVAALVTDALIIPGFGSWLLVPTAFRYLPLGKFEETKRNFQREMQGLIQQQLLTITKDIHDVRDQIVLEDKDPLLQSLKECAQYA